MNYVTKRCYALALKQIRTGLINEGRFLILKKLRKILISIVLIPDKKDREDALNDFWGSVMFESPSQIIID